MHFLTFSIPFYLLTSFASPAQPSVTNGTVLTRQKRYLIFPRGNPTRHQLVAGFGIPVDIVLESINVGYVFKAVYFLPWNSSHWVPQFLSRDEDLLFQPPQQRRNFVELLEADEKPPAEAENEIDHNEEDDWADRSRWTIYRALEAMADQKGYDGRSCLLRTICEAAEAKFSHTSGILGELLHILFSPSTTPDKRIRKEEDDPLYDEYTRAETLASRSSPRFGSSVCSDMFAECPFSLLDLFTGVLQEETVPSELP